MFKVHYNAWAKSGTECTGAYANSSSTLYVSGKDMMTSKSICAYDTYFTYGNGLSGTTSIPATTQMFTVFTDNAVVIAASAFTLGVAAMFI